MRKLLIIRRISGTSMVPLLRPGMIIIATEMYTSLRPNDIVAIKHDGLEKTKRLTKISDGKVYVLGDNPVASTDSRHFGWLPISVVRAKVIWPRPASKSIGYQQATD